MASRCDESGSHATPGHAARCSSHAVHCSWAAPPRPAPRTRGAAPLVYLTIRRTASQHTVSTRGIAIPILADGRNLCSLPIVLEVSWIYACSRPRSCLVIRSCSARARHGQHQVFKQARLTEGVPGVALTCHGTVTVTFESVACTALQRVRYVSTVAGCELNLLPSYLHCMARKFMKRALGQQSIENHALQGNNIIPHVIQIIVTDKAVPGWYLDRSPVGTRASLDTTPSRNASSGFILFCIEPYCTPRYRTKVSRPESHVTSVQRRPT